MSGNFDTWIGVLYKGVIRSCKWKNVRQYNGQKRDRQYNGQKRDRQYNGQKNVRQYNGQKKSKN